MVSQPPGGESEQPVLVYNATSQNDLSSSVKRIFHTGRYEIYVVINSTKERPSSVKAVFLLSFTNMLYMMRLRDILNTCV